MSEYFDSRFVLLSVALNVVVVTLINNTEDSVLGFNTYSLVQLFVSGVLAGFTVPYTKRKARNNNRFEAYLKGGFGMAIVVALCGWGVHWKFQTPDLFWTVVWNFGLNFVSGTALVFLKRNIEILPAWLSNLTQKL